MLYPKVSICIPSYNHADYLSEAINSACNQSYLNIEVLVSNNASTDNTKDVLDTITCNRNIKVFTQENTIDMTSHWNFFLNEIEGDWVMWLCADDILHTNMVQACIDAITDENTDAIFFEYDYLEDGKVTSKVPFYVSDANINSSKQFEVFIKSNNFPLSACLIKTSLIKEIGGFNNQYQFCPDWHLWLDITARYPEHNISYIKSPLFSYRIHENAETNSCILKKKPISEVNNMKKHFIKYYLPDAYQEKFNVMADRNTMKLAKVYEEKAKLLGNLEVADYYNALQKKHPTLDACDVFPSGPPYALP